MKYRTRENDSTGSRVTEIAINKKERHTEREIYSKNERTAEHATKTQPTTIDCFARQFKSIQIILFNFSVLRLFFGIRWVRFK